MPPPKKYRCGPWSRLAVTTLFEIVGEEKQKMPPPAIFLRASALRLMPRPPVIVNPSRRSAFVNPEPNTTAEHCVRVALSTQKSVAGAGGVLAPWMHRLSVASMIVTAGPAFDRTDTPGRIRTDSR